MEKIEVRLISRDTVKPSATSSSLLHPHKLSIFDQLTPAMYFPVILFYAITGPDFNLPQTLTNLKEALSQTLALYYPLSGRIKNNMYVDDFEAGVPYLEARVNSDMIDFLRLPKLENLNEFVPTKVCCKETISHELLPLLGVQINIFEYGIAIGVSFCHKVIDSATASCFLKTWAAFFRGCPDEIIHPNLSEAATLFPPRDDLPEKHLAMMESWWFGEKEVVTRRFVFDSKAISALQDEGKSEKVSEPSRIQALTAFLWKHKLAASQAITSAGTSTRLCVAAQAVNFRPRMNTKTRMDNTFGNLFWPSSALIDLNVAENCDHKICDLLNLVNDSVKEFNSEFLEIFKGKEGYRAISEMLDFMAEASSLKPAPEIHLFSSWTRYFNRVDFGWGKPLWIGVTGKVARHSNTTIFIETQCDNGIEAWVTLDEKEMAVLQQDPEFLAFASPNPGISLTSSIS